jgi:hypothetical protein
MRKEKITYSTYKRTEEGTSATFVVEKDYTQLYDCFCSMARDIHSGTSYKLLFWLLANKTTKDGGIHTDNTVYEEFNKYLTEKCNHCGVSSTIFYRSIAELRDAGALTQVSKGFYYANAYGFWRGSLKDRREHLIKEHKDASYPFYNPDHDTKLIEEKSS